MKREKEIFEWKKLGRNCVLLCGERKKASLALMGCLVLFRNMYCVDGNRSKCWTALISVDVAPSAETT